MAVRLLVLLSLLSVLSALSSRALAQQPPEEPEEITVTGQSTADPEAGPSQVTVVEVADLPASADVAEAVARAPGVVVRRLGGLGDLAQVGIRGAGARHVEVLVDAIPLNPEGGAAVDLSELPLAAFERVEIYRGAAPALLGVSALGGAIALVPGRQVGTGLVLAAGSQMAARSSGTLGVDSRMGHLWASVEALASRGAFLYYDDGALRSDPSDDALLPRENNDNRSLSTLARWQGGPVSILHQGTWRDDGVPGAIEQPSLAARYQLSRQLLGLRVAGAVRASELSARVYGLHRTDRLLDPADEIGLGSGSSEDRTSALGLDGSARIPLSRALRLEGAAGVRLEGHQGLSAAHSRQVGRAILSLPWASDRLAVVPALLAIELQPLGAQPAPLQGFLLPRLGGVWRASEALACKGNLGAFARPPDLVEMYGDRGSLVGNPDLVPERGLQGDAGLVWQRARARLEAVAFLAGYRQLVVWSTGAQGVARPENVGSARIMGLELAGSAEKGIAALSSQLTLTSATNTTDDPTYQGNQLPRQPLVEGWVQLSARPGPLSLAADATATAGTWADTANFHRQPPRLLLGTTLSIAERSRRLSLELDVRNLLGTRSALVLLDPLSDPLADERVRVRQPVVDFVGYPLPGRTAWLAVRWRG